MINIKLINCLAIIFEIFLTKLSQKIRDDNKFL